MQPWPANGDTTENGDYVNIVPNSAECTFNTEVENKERGFHPT